MIAAQLDLLADPEPTVEHRISPAARDHIERGLATSVTDAGYVSSNDWRDRIDPDVNPRWVGLVVRALKTRGVLFDAGYTVPSTDKRGGNAGKGTPVYRWMGPPC